MNKLADYLRTRIDLSQYPGMVWLGLEESKELLAHIERLDAETETMHGVIANALVVAELPEWLRIDAGKAIRPRAMIERNDSKPVPFADFLAEIEQDPEAKAALEKARKKIQEARDRGEFKVETKDLVLVPFVPEGFVAVPVEPTMELFAKMLGRPLLNMDRQPFEIWCEDYRDIIKAARELYGQTD